MGKGIFLAGQNFFQRKNKLPAHSSKNVHKAFGAVWINLGKEFAILVHAGGNDRAVKDFHQRLEVVMICALAGNNREFRCCFFHCLHHSQVIRSDRPAMRLRVDIHGKRFCHTERVALGQVVSVVVAQVVEEIGRFFLFHAQIGFLAVEVAPLRGVDALVGSQYTGEIAAQESGACGKGNVQSCPSVIDAVDPVRDLDVQFVTTVVTTCVKAAMPSIGRRS